MSAEYEIDVEPNNAELSDVALDALAALLVDFALAETNPITDGTARDGQRVNA